MQALKYIFTVLLSIVSLHVVAADAPIPVYAENKTAISVSSNQSEFIVQLKSNPTTGYSWFLREYDKNLLEPIKHVFQAAQDKKLVGAPGYELWTFRVKPAGFTVPQQTMIRFVYARPWETNNSSTQIVFSVTTH